MNNRRPTTIVRSLLPSSSRNGGMQQRSNLNQQVRCVSDGPSMSHYESMMSSSFTSRFGGSSGANRFGGSGGFGSSANRFGGGGGGSGSYGSTGAGEQTNPPEFGEPAVTRNTFHVVIPEATHPTYDAFAPGEPTRQGLYALGTDYTAEDIRKLKKYIKMLKIFKRKNGVTMSPEEEQEAILEAEKKQQQQDKKKKSDNFDAFSFAIFGNKGKEGEEEQTDGIQDFILYDNEDDLNGELGGYDAYMKTLLEQEQESGSVHTKWTYGTDFFRAMGIQEKEAKKAQEAELPFEKEEVLSYQKANLMGNTFSQVVNKYRSEMLVWYLDTVERKRYMDPDMAHIHTQLIKVLCDEHDQAKSSATANKKGEEKVDNEVKDAQLSLALMDAEEELLIAQAQRFLRMYQEKIDSQSQNVPGLDASTMPMGYHPKEQLVKYDYEKTESKVDLFTKESSMHAVVQNLINKDFDSVIYKPAEIGNISFDELKRRVDTYRDTLAREKEAQLKRLDDLYTQYESTLRNHGWVKSQMEQQAESSYTATLEIMLARSANMLYASGSILTDKDTCERAYHILRHSAVAEDDSKYRFYKVCRDSARLLKTVEQPYRVDPLHLFYNTDRTLTSTMDAPKTLQHKVTLFRK